MIDDTIRMFEEATEGDNDLDEAFLDAIGLGGDYITHGSPSTNLQHAVDAVPEGWFFSADIADPDGDYTVNGWNGKMAPDGIDVDGHGRTAQLAVCLAIIRAYKAMGG